MEDTNANVPSVVSRWPEMEQSNHDIDNMVEHNTTPPSRNQLCKSSSRESESRQDSDTLSDTSLPSSSYDGSHLHWKAFRTEVLSPHGVCILESGSGRDLPDSLVALIAASNTGMNSFWELESHEGASLTGSPKSSTDMLFYHLPSFEYDPRLSRCFAPALDREALPERIVGSTSPSFELTRPRSGLAQGFTDIAFSEFELKALPSFLHAKGNFVCETTSNGPAVTIFCPYFILERTFGQKDHRFETANNDCAVGGSWSVRSLEMLYAQAWSAGDKDCPEPPVAFSCTMDGRVAVLNYQWKGDEKHYFMSPVCKFDLADELHSRHFSTWIEAIGIWGVRTLLPVIKASLGKLHLKMSPPLPVSVQCKKPELCLETTFKDESITRALKESFSSLPWRLDINSLTPVSSSVAIWGSPVSHEVSNEGQNYSSEPDDTAISQSSAASTAIQSAPGSRPQAAAMDLAQSKLNGSHATLKMSSPQTPAALTTSSDREQVPSDLSLAPPRSRADFAMHKHLSDAVSEIHDLQAQLQQVQQEVDGLNLSHQVDLSGLRNTVNTLLHKVSTRSDVAPSPAHAGSTKTTNLSLNHGIAQYPANVITTPTKPRPAALSWERLKPQRRRSALQQVMTINTDVPVSATSKPSEEAQDKTSPPKSMQDPSGPGTPLPSARSIPQTSRTIRIAFTPGPYSATSPSPAFSIRSDISNVVVIPRPPPGVLEILKWVLALLSIQSLGTFIPSTILRIVFLGCITDFALLAFASPHWATTTQYFLQVVKS